MAEERVQRRLEAILVADVVVEGDDLFDDGVNVASRLEGFRKARLPE